MKVSTQTWQRVLNEYQANPKCFFHHDEQVIYGTGSAQIVYLRILYYLHYGQRPKRIKPRHLKEASKDQSVVKERRPEVSNYWLSILDIYKRGDPLPNDEPGDFWGRFEDEAPRLFGPDFRQPRNDFKAPQFQDQGVWQVRVDSLVNDTLVRRSCKFLLYDTITSGREIGYALDDLDLGLISQYVDTSVLNVDTYALRMFQEEVTRQGLPVQERKVPVCTSELREIFRYWDFFSDHVTFYQDFFVVDPPWLRPQYAQAWSAYARHRAEKLRGKVLNGLVDQVVDAHDQGLHSHAINFFHDLDPSRYRRHDQHNVVTNEPETQNL